VLFDFQGDTGSATWLSPVLFDTKGTLFNATTAVDYKSYIFELTPGSGNWSFDPIYGGGYCLVFDQAGNLYGCIGQGKYGRGSIGELSPGPDGWTYTDLYDFCKLGCQDGIEPESPLSWDSHGNIYGTTLDGGDGYGVAFQMRPNGDGTWTYHVIHSFGSFKNDGTFPYAGLVLDAYGNAYGATAGGGAYNLGRLFKLSPSSDGHWKETALYDFSKISEGAAPLFTPVFDRAGNLYGMAQGGDENCGPCGVIFKLAPQKSGKWKYSLVHTFHGGDGAGPYGVVLDSKGNIFGTTAEGGDYSYGVAFEITP
jgi:hypothetical protein